MAPKKSRAPRTYPYPVGPYKAGPFKGAKNVADPVAADPEYAEELVNVYPDAPPGTPSSLRTRPVFTKLNSVAIGAAGARLVQAIVQHTRLDGSEYSMAFCGGRMYRYNWSTAESTDVTPGGISIDTVKPIFNETLADYLIVSDGANRPWKYNAATNAGSVLTDLAYALYGPLAVYDAKLAGIKDSDRNLLVWSEETNPDVGYENVGFLNRWRLGQTEQEALEAIVARNEGLYYFRASSIGVITSGLDADAQTTGTTDAIDDEIGTRSPSSVRRHSTNGILFVDQFGRPRRIAPGDLMVPLWADAWKTLESVEISELDRVRAEVIPGLDVALFALSFAAEKTAGTGRPKEALAFRLTDDQWIGRWSHALGATAPMRAMGIWKDASKQERFIFGDDAGFLYALELPTSALLTDNATEIPTEVLSGATGYDPDVEQTFDEMSLSSRSAACPVSLELEDALGIRTPALPLSLGKRATVGTDVTSRLVKVRITSTQKKERFTFTDLRISGHAVGDHPEAL